MSKSIFPDIFGTGPEGNFSVFNYESSEEPSGLTKRELFAAMALNGLLSSRNFVYGSIEAVIQDSVRAADGLINELDKKE